jgi:hypothetical protein
VLEIILRFLTFTGIKKDTFGRLAAGDPDIIYRLEHGERMTEEAELRVISFIENYERAKEFK